MPVARFVRTISPDEREALQQQYHQTHDADVRTRCQMILLSSTGRSVAEIAAITLMNADTVLYWFDRYEAAGLDGLADRPRSGRPPKSLSAL